MPNNSIRRRGAQPGNTNALKHGFYSARFTPEELNDLESINSTINSLNDEALLMKVIIRRLFDLISNPADDADLLGLIRTLSLAVNRLASLLRTQERLSRSNEDTLSLLSTALNEVTHDLGIR